MARASVEVVEGREEKDQASQLRSRSHLVIDDFQIVPPNITRIEGKPWKIGDKKNAHLTYVYAWIGITFRIEDG